MNGWLSVLQTKLVGVSFVVDDFKFRIKHCLEASSVKITASDLMIEETEKDPDKAL